MSKKQEIINLLREEKYTDAEISNMVGAHYRLVNNYRRSEGFAKTSKWSKYEPLLGIKTDKEIAKELGITTNAVTRKRLRMGIISENEFLHKKIIQKYSKKLHNPSFEIVTSIGGRIDILTIDSIYECKPELTNTNILSAIAQLIIYAIDYPFHKKYIITSKISCYKHLIASLDKLGISLVIQKI